jgi:polyphosphate kinase
MKRPASKKPRSTSKRVRTPGAFFNRELSWLAFNERVLEEAAERSNALIERVKFAAITASNLDEFFMVRVARLKNAAREGDTDPDATGLSPAQQLSQVSARVHAMVDRLYALVTGELLPALAAEGIRVVGLGELDEAQRAAAAAYFRDEVLPALTPLAIDVSRPFPMLSSLSLNLALRLAPGEDEDRPRLAVVQLPLRLPRLVRVAGGDGVTVVPLEDIIRGGFDALFPGQTVIESVTFRLSRDAELELDDEGGRSYLEALEEELRHRRKSDVVRLEIEDRASDALVGLLIEQADLNRKSVV